MKIVKFEIIKHNKSSLTERPIFRILSSLDFFLRTGTCYTCIAKTRSLGIFNGKQPIRLNTVFINEGDFIEFLIRLGHSDVNSSLSGMARYSYVQNLKTKTRLL